MNKKNLFCVLSILLLIGITLISTSFFYQSEAKTRKIEYAVVKPCDDLPVHFKIKDGKIQQLNSIKSLLKRYLS